MFAEATISSLLPQHTCLEGFYSLALDFQLSSAQLMTFCPYIPPLAKWEKLLGLVLEKYFPGLKLWRCPFSLI